MSRRTPITPRSPWRGAPLSVALGALVVWLLAFQAGAATVYIDPTVTGPGTGTIEDPYKDWASVTWTAGNAYLQKCGTTYTAATRIAPSAGGSSAVVRITLGSYGTGAKPIIQGSGSSECVYLNNRSHVTIQDLDLRNTSYVAFKMQSSFADFLDVIVQRCTIRTTGTGDTNYPVYILSNTGWDIHSVAVLDCDLSTTCGSSACIRAEHGANKLYAFTIQGNTFHDSGGSGVVFYGGAASTTVDANNSSPYGIDINGNVFRDLARSAISTFSGLNSTGANYIRNNTLQRIGLVSSSHINAMQLQWCRGLTVEYNTLDTVTTSNPDGDGIELDWAWTDESHKSDGVIVRYNRINGCASGAVSAGINCYAAINCRVYYNVCFNNSVGIAVTRSHSTGNEFYNNTLVYNTYGGHADNGAVDPAPASVWTNNLFALNTSYGFKCSNGSTVPTETYSVFYGNGGVPIYNGASVAVHASSTTTVNPRLRGAYRTRKRLQGTAVAGVHDQSGWIDYSGRAFLTPPQVGAGAYAPTSVIKPYPMLLR